MGSSDRFGRSTASYESSGKSYPTIYKDSKNLDTIGIGHLVTDKDRASKRFAKPLSDQQQLALFVEDKKKITDMFYKKHPNYTTYPDTVKNGLNDLAFNQGQNFLDKFKKMKIALDNRNFPTAAEELITGSKPGTESKYVKDVKKDRAYANAMRISSGYDQVFAEKQKMQNQLAQVDNQGGLGGNTLVHVASNQ